TVSDTMESGLSMKGNRTDMSLRRSVIATLHLMLMVTCAAVGRPVPPQRVLFEEPLSHDVFCLLAVDPAPWRPAGPATVYIRLENRTDKDLDLRIVPELYL